MIKIIKAKLKNGESYKSRYNTLHIKELKDKTITYFITNPYRITYIPNIRRRTYEDFINKVIKGSNFKYTDNTTFLYDLIITPVKKEREKLNLKKKVLLKLQKEKEKEQKMLEKEQEKEKQKEKKKLIKKINKDNSNNSTNNITNINKDIVIEDYSDKAIAIFGKTYLIKDELKNIGAKYNPRLNRNGSKEPGWIISKRKKQEVENIINNN